MKGGQKQLTGTERVNRGPERANEVKSDGQVTETRRKGCPGKNRAKMQLA